MSGLDVQQEVLAALASLPDDLGESAFSLVVTPEPADKPDDPWDPPAADFPDPVSVPAMRVAWTEMEMEDETLRVNDIKLMVAAGLVVPSMSSPVELGGQEYAVAKVVPFSPTGVPLYYFVFLRR